DLQPAWRQADGCREFLETGAYRLRRPRTHLKLSSSHFRLGLAQPPRHMLPLQDVVPVRVTCAYGRQLRQKGGAGQGKDIVPLPGAELMQEPNAIAVATHKDRLQLAAAKPFDAGLPYAFFDPVQTLKPLGVPCHWSIPVFQGSLPDLAKFCH